MLAKFWVTHLVRGSTVLNWYYWALGAKIGRNSVINTVDIFEPDLVTIGDETVLEEEVALHSSYFHEGYLILDSIKIGNRCLLQPRSVVNAGVVIQDRVELGPLSSVSPFHVLHANALYEGSPARRSSETGLVSYSL